MFGQGGFLDHKDTVANITLFAKEVLPRLRELNPEPQRGHRVLAAGGKIGGFSAPGGSAAKIRMLAREGGDLEPPRPGQQSLGF